MTIAATTAYMAIADDAWARAHDSSSLRHIHSGGAPIPPTVVEDLEARTGMRIRPVYGLTESTGATHLAPLEGSIPVEPSTGALSVGFRHPAPRRGSAPKTARTFHPARRARSSSAGPRSCPLLAARG